MKAVKIISSVLLTFFGGLSVFMTLSIIFDWFDIREKEGNYVLFIVYSNLVSGVIYLLSAWFIHKKNDWAKTLLALSSAILIVAFVALQVYIKNEGVYEEKTVKAMIFRIAFTIVLTLTAFYLSYKNQKNNNY